MSMNQWIDVYGGIGPNKDRDRYNLAMMQSKLTKKELHTKKTSLKK